VVKGCACQGVRTTGNEEESKVERKKMEGEAAIGGGDQLSLTKNVEGGKKCWRAVLQTGGDRIGHL